VQFLLYLSVLLLSGFKFLPAVALSLAYGLGTTEQMVLTGLGGTLGVVVSTYGGDWIRRYWAHLHHRRGRSQAGVQGQPQPRRRGQYIWQRFGLWGVSILVPFLMPLVATGIALAFGTPKRKILRYMVPSILLWAVAFALLGSLVRPLLAYIGL
jgi:hypothetical protein